MERRRPIFVYAVLALGLATFASSSILIRYAADLGAPPVSLVFWRTMLSTLLLAPFAFTKGRADLRALSRRDWRLIATSAMLLSAHFVLWVISLYYTTVASATVLVTMSPIFLAIFGFLLLGERYRWPLYAAIVVGVFGAGLLALDGPSRLAPHPLLGNTLALSAALMMALYLIVGRMVRQHVSFLAYVFPLYALIAVVVGVAALVKGEPLFGLDGRVFALCVAMALGPQLLGHGSFNYALRYISAVMLGLLTLIEPIGSTVAAYFLFGEAPGPLGALGILVTLSSVAVAVWFEQRRLRPKALVEPANG